MTRLVLWICIGFLGVPFLNACGGKTTPGADGDAAETETIVDGAAESETEAEKADADGADPDAFEADSDETETNPGFWKDSSTGLMWQNPPNATELAWQEGLDYCEHLVLAGYDDWRAPTLSELRSLIRGCELTASGGSCKASDACLDESSCKGDDCAGCVSLESSCFWPKELLGKCTYYRTSSSASGVEYPAAWYVEFSMAYIDITTKLSGEPIRCVR